MNQTNKTVSEKKSGFQADQEKALYEFNKLCITFLLWVFGVLNLLFGIIGVSLLVIVPLFGLENDAWQRPDNHILLSVFSSILAGTICIIGARGSYRTRYKFLILCFSAGGVIHTFFEHIWLKIFP